MKQAVIENEEPLEGHEHCQFLVGTDILLQRVMMFTYVYLGGWTCL